MGEEEPPLVGAQCQYIEVIEAANIRNPCKQLDFLHSDCLSCGRVFCEEHRTETAHKCSRAGEWAARQKRVNMLRPSLGAGKNMAEIERPCASPQCQTIIGTSTSVSAQCRTCRRHYCLKHRMYEDHDCKNVVPLGARAGKFEPQHEQAMSALSKLKAWGVSQKEKAARAGRRLPKSRTTTASARMIAVNQLKKTAKGDDKLAPEKRVYLTVEAEAKSTTSKYPRGAFFYSKGWVMGKVLDAAAKGLQVENINNQGTEETSRLRVYHVEGGRLLDFNEKVGDVLIDGNTIVLLRGSGPVFSDLIDLDRI